jgi:hypothetical protein
MFDGAGEAPGTEGQASPFSARATAFVTTETRKFSPKVRLIRLAYRADAIPLARRLRFREHQRRVVDAQVMRRKL